MTVQSIGPTTSLLYLSLEDLRQRGLHPDLLTREQAFQLAREGLSSLDRSVEESLTLESYPDKNGLLLFIHTPAPTRSVWRFPDSDAFLDAVLAVREALSGPIYRWQDCFWLVEDGDADPRLAEYADRMEHDPLLPARLAEYAVPFSLLNT